MPNLFSVPIFFIVFRETVEAAIIVSVLLGLAKQIVDEGQSPVDTETESNALSVTPADDALQRRRLLRKMKIQVLRFPSCRHTSLTCEFFRFISALLQALSPHSPSAPRKRYSGSISSTNLHSFFRFIVVWVKKASNLWSKSEELWEGRTFLFNKHYLR